MRHTSSIPAETQEITLRLEQFDDIFSDFDIRPYSKRALSVDFLDEIRRASLDKTTGGIELNIHVPERERDENKELVIKERLNAHFKRHYHLLATDKRHVTRMGSLMVFLGVICMIAATFIVFEDPTENLWRSFLVVFLEPAAWFLLWEGMDQILFNSKGINPELNFYKKMADSKGHIHIKSH